MGQNEESREVRVDSATNDATLTNALEPETLISKFGVVHDGDCSFGDGKFEFKNGDTFQGLFQALKTGVITREGNGVYTTVDGHVYDGFWTSDTLDCPDALIYYPDASSYSGSIDKMKYNGQGRYQFPDGTFIDAKFSDNLPTEGEESSPHLNYVDRCGIQWFGETGKTHVTMFPVHQFIPKGWKVTGKHVPQISSEGVGIPFRAVIPKFTFPTRSHHIFQREGSGA
ncbi:uncharacterized protein LOC124164270 [Ischnura elegans]|uniref:uncharacterized protein LOC124164270 n=1 Tax=Ischnura elegans TaxID=197161 RepID=UPI001ED86A06|nr:uncharacterized protein LOC124164270 [Ischnura elegans]XP_046397473.1 uncharacterized protein LOC124164270 [Ischnura elegans]XP_046397474.1 uncharacterized protein LOC124164270 [Ischnura elegans]XP_046397475.1 uncharacterized protein LOC124164270 [Ischnura elegans]XP_046397476.1 uncharacterized protein LOC124164270 [Ischnura elegans]XP_046397477.1 uncharacterized protein LOC124164270 [Ischnura elegans]